MDHSRSDVVDNHSRFYKEDIGADARFAGSHSNGGWRNYRLSNVRRGVEHKDILELYNRPLDGRVLVRAAGFHCTGDFRYLAILEEDRVPVAGILKGPGPSPNHSAQSQADPSQSEKSTVNGTHIQQTDELLPARLGRLVR